ncbi:hypothetical protein P692DRAFT_201705103 [Suillus brevipes Sb2]|nr:hypothetical protein P692DRAFT_201705103 [Suillus brevipes Sb2]
MSNAESSVSHTNVQAERSGSVEHRPQAEGSVEHWQAEGSVEHRQAEGSVEHRQAGDSHNQADLSAQAQQRRRITQLEEKLVALESGRTAKERNTHYYISQGRAIRRVVTLFESIEDLVAENDRRCDIEEDASTTFESTELEHEEYGQMLKMVSFRHVSDRLTFAELLFRLRQGADAARGDDTSKLKTLVSEWVNREFKPDYPVDPDDKHSRGFTNDACGKLLCPSELDWNNPAVKAGIRDRADGYLVTELSFPTFVYEKYTTNPDDLEAGLFKSKILLQAYKAVFTSPSSAKDVEGDGDGADIIYNNRRAKKSFSALKVKKHVRFALSSVTSWRSIDGDFDYVHFWRTIVDFFEKPPGRDARRRVDMLLEWWTRKVFGRKCRDSLTQAARDNMSVNALRRQRVARDDASFDSP